MMPVLLTFTVLSMLYVFFTLIMGSLAVANKTGSNKWMHRRVYGQVVAIILLFLTFGSQID